MPFKFVLLLVLVKGTGESGDEKVSNEQSWAVW